MAQKVALAQPKFIKVKDIETSRSGYNVYVKIVSAQARQIETRDGKKIPMVDAVVADQTASAKAFFKGEAAHLIQKDNVVAIRNGVKRFIKDHISLEIDLFGRVTLEKGVTIASTSATNISEVEHKRAERPRGERRDNRQGDRRDNRRREGGQRPRRDDRPREDRPREDRPRREDRERRPREDREDRKPREDREDRKPREDREDRPKRNDREERKPREDKPREERRDNRDYERRNNDRDVDRRDNRTDYRRENRDNRDERPRRNDRDYDRTNRGGDNYRENRPVRQYEEKREENRERRAPLQWNKIADITPGEDRLNINAKVISAQKVGPRLRCVIGDETGIANAFLPENEFLYEGEYVVLFNARSEVVKEHIEIQLDRRGRIEKSRREVPRVHEEFNLSHKAWVPIE